MRKWHVLPQAAEHITCAGGGAQQHCSGTYAALRGCFAASAAVAVLLACQLCSSSSTGQHKREAESKRAEESRASHGPWKQLSLQRAFTVKVCCPPPYFSKGKWALPAPPLAKKSPAALSKRPIFLGASLRGQNRLPGCRLSSPSPLRGRRYPGVCSSVH